MFSDTGRSILTRVEPATQILTTKRQSTAFSFEGSCKTLCLQMWHGHLARVSWAGRPCHVLAGFRGDLDAKHD